MLAYSITRKRWLAIFLGAFIMLLLDVFIEPLTCKLNLWCWLTNGQIPVRNFLSWFGMSFFLLIPFSYLKKENENRFPVALILTLMMFFVGVSLFVK